MNRPMKARWRWLGIVLLAALPGGKSGGEEQPARSASGERERVEDRSGTDRVRTPPMKNPFVYRATEDERGLVPADAGRLPHGIRLAAVLIPKAGEAVAVLRLPGEGTPVFVRENDLVSIDPRAADSTRAGATAGSATRASAETAPFYLLIKSITSTGVDVAPRVRPTEVHLIR